MSRRILKWTIREPIMVPLRWVLTYGAAAFFPRSRFQCVWAGAATPKVRDALNHMLADFGIFLVSFWHHFGTILSTCGGGSFFEAF